MKVGTDQRASREASAGKIWRRIAWLIALALQSGCVSASQGHRVEWVVPLCHSEDAENGCHELPSNMNRFVDNARERMRERLRREGEIEVDPGGERCILEMGHFGLNVSRGLWHVLVEFPLMRMCNPDWIWTSYVPQYVYSYSGELVDQAP